MVLFESIIRTSSAVIHSRQNAAIDEAEKSIQQGCVIADQERHVSAVGSVSVGALESSRLIEQIVTSWAADAKT